MSAIDNRLLRMKNYVDSNEYKQASEKHMASMNRAEKRDYLRREAKIKECVKKLTPVQLDLVEQLSDMKASKEADKRIDDFKGSLDRALLTIIIEYFPDKSWSELDRVVDRFGEHVIEDSNKTILLENECKGDRELMNKIVQKYENELKERVNKLLEDGVSQKKAVEMLIIEFPKLSKSMITNNYKRLKSEYDEQLEEDLKVQEAADEIMEIMNEKEGNKEVDKILEEADKFVEQAEKEPKIVCNGNSCRIVEEDAIEVKEKEKVMSVVKNEVKKSGLKVLSMTVQGENGTYKVCPEGIELSNSNMILAFENETQLNIFVNEFREVFEMANRQ